MRKETLWNNDWLFTETEPDAFDGITIFPENFSHVDIPHDFLIHDSKNLYRDCDGWYKKLYSFEKSDNTFLRFEGIYMDSTVYVNKKEAFQWKYGYTEFEADITNFLSEGENEVLVRVCHRAPNSRWYSGAGIYRNVHLIQTKSVHILHNGVYIAAEKKDPVFSVFVTTSLSSTADNDISIHHTILDADTAVVSFSKGSFEQNLLIADPKLWTLEKPYLYKLKTEVYESGILCDTVYQNFGLRTISFTPDKGFFLNEKRIKINGACQHHDLGCLGSAFNKEAALRQLLKLKEMGVNAVRTSHNPFPKEFLDLCDQYGILVMSEFLDMWEMPKTKFDYARFFTEWVEKDAESWICQGRNHPCIIMWSVGNEIPDTHAGNRGKEVMERLLPLVEKHDPRHNARATLCSNYMPWENTQKCADVIKLIGYNYAEKYYKEHHEKHPDWIIYGSETASVVFSRGIYHFPLKQQILTDDDGQCSALGNSSTSWGAKSVERCITDDRDSPFSLGQFIWTGWDYIGEPTPYHSKNSFFGQIDTAGFPKDSFYIFKASWTDYKKDPFIHIFPYWDFSPGQIIDVRVVTNAPSLELFLNGNSLGKKNINIHTDTSITADFSIPYEKGVLKALAYDEKGTVIAECKRCSFSDPVSITLKTDKSVIQANGIDLSFVEISVTDKDGNPVENALNRMFISVQGEGRLVGVDNGDSTNWDSYKGNTMRLFSGKLLAVIASTEKEGCIQLTVESEGLRTAKLDITSQKTSLIRGISCTAKNTVIPFFSDRPVRKIELITAVSKITPSTNEVEVEAVLYPKDSQYTDLEWRCTNDAGIDIVIASVTKTQKGALIKAHSDGKFNLRCGIRNGKEEVSSISMKEFTIEGFGCALMDPYSYITGGLYTLSMGDIGTGNERGFASSRDGKSSTGFERLDFGSSGSKTLNLDIFCLDDDPFEFEIWDGNVKEDNAVFIAKLLYHKKSIWNVYQSETYTLPVKLRGVKTLSFVFTRKAHIKGFSFKKLNKETEPVSAAEYDTISGDAYTVGTEEITDIGNNVSITYNDFDFTTVRPSKISICGKTKREKNPIQIRFTSPSSQEILFMAEFTRSDIYSEQIFDLSGIQGLLSVSFIFLPGSQFDFKSFTFVP